MPSQPLHTSPDISQITEYLFVSVWPEARHADEIVQLGIGLILSMHWLPPQTALRRLPITVLWLPTIDTPLTPMPMRSLRRGLRQRCRSSREGAKCFVTAKLAFTAAWQWHPVC